MKTALLLTGAAARISQEVAVIDELIEKHGLTISPEDTFLAGFSSGALNIAGINACFRKENPLSWDEYYKKELLFQLTTNDIFFKRKFFPFITSPLREQIEKFTKQSGFSSFADLSFDSFILVFSILRLKVYWADNRLNEHNCASINDLLMATSAMPILFQEQSINSVDNRRCSLPIGKYLDGGSLGSFKQFKPHLGKYVNSNGPLEKMYIISPMREVSAEDFDEFNSILPSNDILKLNLKDFTLLKSFLGMISMNGFDTFVKSFHQWVTESGNTLANEIYVCVPELESNFPILNFNKQEQQYYAVREWANKAPHNLAIPLNDYVEKISKAEKI